MEYDPITGFHPTFPTIEQSLFKNAICSPDVIDLLMDAYDTGMLGPVLTTMIEKRLEKEKSLLSSFIKKAP